MMRWLILAGSMVALPALGQRTNATLDCRYSGRDFIYNCVIQLDPPIEGVQLAVGADMPSMPMAHNVKPAKAVPTKIAGQYRARLDLEMPGEWAVKLRLSGAVRDQIVLHYQFDERGARPIRQTAPSPRK